MTNQELNEIKSALIKEGKKVSSFPLADSLTGNEKVPIIQGGKNVVVPASEFMKGNSSSVEGNDNIIILPLEFTSSNDEEKTITREEYNIIESAINSDKILYIKLGNSYVIPSNYAKIENYITFMYYEGINERYNYNVYQITITEQDENTLLCSHSCVNRTVQKELESGEDVKTINGQSILGGGDVTIVFDLEYIGLPVVINNTQTISGYTLSRLTDAIQKNTIFKCEYNNEILYCNSIQQIDNNININFILNSENNILHKLTLKVYVNAGAYNWILEPIFEQEETIQNVYSLDVTSRSFNINKTEVEKLYNHLVNNGIVICKLSDSEKFIPTNIHYDNMDVYSISLSKGLDILNPNGRYVNIVISTSDGENYTCDTYTGDDSDYPYCLLTYAANDTITNDKFNEIYYKINSGRTPKYINEHGSIIMFNVDEVTDSRIELSTPMLNSEFLYYSISIYKNLENDNYIFSFAETNN